MSEALVAPCVADSTDGDPEGAGATGNGHSPQISWEIAYTALWDLLGAAFEKVSGGTMPITHCPISEIGVAGAESCLVNAVLLILRARLVGDGVPDGLEAPLQAQSPSNPQDEDLTATSALEGDKVSCLELALRQVKAAHTTGQGVNARVVVAAMEETLALLNRQR
jgi:hypothetical protein